MITGFYASILAFVYVCLSISVIKRRREVKVALGYSDDEELQRNIRAHANFTEYAPIAIILFLLVEYNSISPFLVHLLFLIFLSGRILHAYSLSRHETYENGKLLHNPRFRIWGMTFTLLSIGIASIALIHNYISYMVF